MEKFSVSDNTRHLLLQPRAWLVAWLTLGLLAISAAVHSAEVEFSQATQACLACHDKPGMVKKLENAQSFSLHVSGKAYAESMHKDTECEDCHDAIDAKTHGKMVSEIKSHRSFAMDMGESCRSCHKKKVTEYEDSIHAALVKDGNSKAPLCSSCHNPHTVRSTEILTPITDTPCAQCHEEIFKAYANDVHGQQRSAKGIGAPLCAGCHQAHNVKAASLGNGVKDACLACHKDAVQLHKVWLPNTDRHFEAILCAACHSPNAQRRVNLRLYDGSNKHQVSEKMGVPQFDRRTDSVDTQNLGLNERALWSLLKEFNQDSHDGKTVLQGRLEVSSGVAAHQLSDKSKAIKDCNFCHQKGAEPFQSVSLTIAGPDGRPLRHGIQKDVLNSLLSIDSVRGFYAIGGTRIKLFDTLLVMVFLGALSVPLVHMTVKRLFKNIREKLERERLAARADPGRQEPSPALTGDRRADGTTNK
ncbi:MAG: cytochrome c3 family protein [Rhodoferax sp.]|nr:cytochrome c3 family protein [Rhodoferax sp.]